MRPWRGTAVVAVVGAAALLLSACGGGGEGSGGTDTGGYAECGTDPVGCATVPADQVRQGGQLSFAIEKNIPNWNVLSSEGNVLETGMVTKGFLPYTFVSSPDLKMQLNTDLMVSADQTNPTTLVYKIKPEATWDDGTPITAADFAYNWKTQNPTQCPDCSNAGNGGYSSIANVVGSDNGKTVTVTMSKPFTDWRAFFSSGAPLYPAHIAAKHGDLNTPAGLASSFDWLGKNVPTYSGGPYKVSKWEDNVALTLVPNPKWYGATKPKLDQLIFRVITDATQEPIALQNNEVQVIYPQPQVDIVEQLRQIPNVSMAQGLGLQWEHYDMNLRNPFLKDKALRVALFTAVNRQDVIAKTAGQFNPEVKPLNSLMFVPGQDGYQDNVGDSGIGSGDIEKAKKVLTDAGYTGVGTALTTKDKKAVPALRIRYTVGNAVRQSQCELFAQYAKQLGVNVTVQPTDDLGTTLTSGDYDVMNFAWVFTPFPFQNAQQTFLSTSGSNYGKYTNPKTDQMINTAAESADPAAATKQLNDADKIILQDAYELPLYQKPTLIASQDTTANVRNNSTLDGPTFNVSEWGLKAEG